MRLAPGGATLRLPWQRHADLYQSPEFAHSGWRRAVDCTRPTRAGSRLANIGSR